MRWATERVRWKGIRRRQRRSGEATPSGLGDLGVFGGPCRASAVWYYAWLLNQNYARGGTALPAGVGVLGLGPIGISITGIQYDVVGANGRAIGTFTSCPNSSATN
jgi:hypothetical protein